MLDLSKRPSRIRHLDKDRNGAILARIKQETKLPFDVQREQNILQGLPINNGDGIKKGLVLSDLSETNKQDLLSYLARTINLQEFTHRVHASRASVLQKFDENDRAARIQNARHRHKHDQSHIADLLEENRREDTTLDKYGWCHLPDIFNGLRPLEAISGVYVLPGQDKIDMEEIRLPLKENKVVFVPFNQDSGDHWVLKAFRINPESDDIQLIHCTERLDGFCGDQAILEAYRIVCEELVLDLSVPSNVQDLYRRMRGAADNSTILFREAIVDAIDTGRNLKIEYYEPNRTFLDKLWGQDWSALVKEFNEQQSVERTSAVVSQQQRPPALSEQVRTREEELIDEVLKEWSQSGNTGFGIELKHVFSTDYANARDAFFNSRPAAVEENFQRALLRSPSEGIDFLKDIKDEEIATVLQGLEKDSFLNSYRK